MTNLILLDSEIYAEYDANVGVYEDTGGEDPAEDSAQDVSDILFVASEYRTTGSFPKSKRIA